MPAKGGLPFAGSPNLMTPGSAARVKPDVFDPRAIHPWIASAAQAADRTS